MEQDITKLFYWFTTGFQQKMIEFDRTCQIHSISSFSQYRKTGDLWFVTQRQVVEDTRHRSGIDSWWLRRGMFCQLSRAKGGVPVFQSQLNVQNGGFLPSASVLSAVKSHMRANVEICGDDKLQRLQSYDFVVSCELKMLFIEVWHFQLGEHICHHRGSIQWKRIPTKRASKTYWFA